ncbi:MAG: RNA ligase (ATP) [Candidatus Paceibacterota bacterium]
MFKRKLASIQRIKKLHTLPQFDNLYLAEVLGWKVLVRKEEFKEGDLCVYFEIDSVVPEKEVFEFLRKSNFKVKTIKMRGVYSQGLALPVSVIIDSYVGVGEYDRMMGEGLLKEGDDLTEWLGIKKSEEDCIVQGGDMAGKFPVFLPKTDEVRIQVCEGVLEKWKGEKFYITEKVDGTSFTCFYIRNKEAFRIMTEKKDIGINDEGGKGFFGVCSRNFMMKPPGKENVETVYWRVVEKFDIYEKLRDLCIKENRDLCLQGEIVGPKIQKNKYKLREVKVFFFSVYDVSNGEYVGKKEFKRIIKELELETVPFILEELVLNQIEDGVSKLEILQGMAENVKSVVNKEVDVGIEGVVVRSVEERKDIEIGRLSFKVINPKFLVKFGE